MNKKSIRSKIISLALTSVMATAAMPGAVHAALTPEYFTLNDSYNAALNSGDHSGVVNYGSQIVDLIHAAEIKGEPVDF